jgi:lipid-A-disaccharide synthase
MKDTYKIFIIAGEASGDLLGVRLITALQKKYPNHHFIIHGIGGDLMVKAGLRPLFPMAELSVMGLAEVLPKLFQLIKRITQTLQTIADHHYDLIITIDSPDFSFRVLKALRHKNIQTKAIHYVAPSVWAWRPKRAKKIAKLYQHLLCLLPFEPPYFIREGLPATFIGHAVIEGEALKASAERFFARHAHLSPQDKIICLLPGSRVGEIKRHLPLFLQATNEIKQKGHEIKLIIPTLPHLQKMVTEMIDDPTITVIADYDGKYDAFKASRFALAASGTVALELAMTQTPMIVAYKVNKLTAFLARFLVKIPFVSLPNIILNEKIVPELLQEKCTVSNLVQEAIKLIEDQASLAKQKNAFVNVKNYITPHNQMLPSEYAAEVILRVLDNNPK